jgi:hypothetical protein
MSRRRAILVWTLVVVASLLALISSLTIWTKRQLLDTNNWTKTSAELLANQQVQTALAVKLNDALFQQVDLEAALKERLPPNVDRAAPLLAATIENGGERAIAAFLATEQAQQLWQEVNRTAHTALVNVLEGKSVGPVSSDINGDLVLDLQPLVTRVADRLGLGNVLASHVPPGSNEIVLLRSNQLKTAQDAVFLLRVLSVLLVILVFALYALAIYLARGRRRVLLEATGSSLALVGLLLLVIRRIAGNIVVNSVVSVDANKPAVHQVWLIATSLMRDLGIALIAYGLLALLAGILAGPSRAATWIRRELAPTFRRSPWIVHGVGLALFLIVIAWGPTNATRQLYGVLILAALFFTGLELWRRQTLREFPPPGAPPPQAAQDAPSVTATLPG